MRFGTLSLLFVTLAMGDGCAIRGAGPTPSTGTPAVALARTAPARVATERGAAEGTGPAMRAAGSGDSVHATGTVRSAATTGGTGTAFDGSTGANTRTASAISAGPIVGGARVTSAIGLSGEGPRVAAARPPANPADVSGVWIWEHRGPVPTGDEKQEREEWHVDQQGDHISGYYDRVVREISTDGHAFRCSMGLEFEIATRYRIHGEVRGNQVLIYESSFEVLSPSACDNGQRRLDAYEGQASDDEVRLAWGVGAQVLRRPRPDVPTQHF